MYYRVRSLDAEGGAISAVFSHGGVFGEIVEVDRWPLRLLADVDDGGGGSNGPGPGGLIDKDPTRKHQQK